MIQLCVVLLLPWLLPLHLHAVPAHKDDHKGRARKERYSTERVQAITSHLKARLDILERVDVAIVAHNPLVLSVETKAGRSGPFVINVDRTFIEQLTEEELEASLAHELGHVWIYTHHPYLQTERLANDIAMRVVSRSTLEPVYEKVWQRTGTKGNLAEFIGQPGSLKTSQQQH
jgi:Zn-dependent peptidase ImmA (M78 family)